MHHGRIIGLSVNLVGCFGRQKGYYDVPRPTNCFEATYGKAGTNAREFYAELSFDTGWSTWPARGAATSTAGRSRFGTNGWEKEGGDALKKARRLLLATTIVRPPQPLPDACVPRPDRKQEGRDVCGARFGRNGQRVQPEVRPPQLLEKKR